MHWLVQKNGMRSVIPLDWRILFEIFVDYLYFMRKVENNICFTGENWNKVGCVKKKMASFVISIYLQRMFFHEKHGVTSLFLKNYFGT